MIENGEAFGEPIEPAELVVVVVSYNVRELLRACLRATCASLTVSGISSSVIVVDNASADGSAQMVATEFPQVYLVASPTNLGFAGGNNLALRMLGFAGAGAQRSEQIANRKSQIGDPPYALRPTHYVLLLNPDAEPLDDAIGQMVRFLAEHPLAGGVGARLQYADGSFQHGAFRFPGLLQLWFDLFPPRPQRLLDSRLNGRYGRALYDAGRPFGVDFVLGAALMVRREAIAAAGLLDEGYFMYAEEVDWCWRMQRIGWSFFCVPAARVMHHGGASTRQFRAQSFVNLWRSRWRLYGRFYGPVRRRLAAAIVRLGMGAERRRARVSAARGEIDAEELRGRLAAVREVDALTADR